MKPLASSLAKTAVCSVLLLNGLAFAQAQTPTPPAKVTASDSQGLTLDQSIAMALRQSGDTQSASRSFAASREDVRSVRSDLYPQVSGSVNYAYSDGSNRVTTIDNTSSGGTQTVSTRSGQTTTNLSVTQNIFDSGLVSTRIKQAQANAVGAAGTYGNARNALAYEVAQRFYEQLRQTRLVAQRQSQVSLAQSQLGLVQAQFAVGSVARSDIQSILVNVSQAKLDLSTARNDLRIAQTNFRNSLGLGRGEELLLHDDLPPTVIPATFDLNALSATATPTPVPTATPQADLPQLDSLDNYVALAGRLRPDIVQTQAAVQSAQANVKLAKIDASPQVTATAGYSLDPRDTGSRGFTLSTGLSIPIFNSGGLKASVRSAQDSLAASNITLEQTRKDVAADVETAYVDIVGQADRLSNAAALVEQAQVNLENATAKYRSGAGIVLDIVNAQTQLFDAQNSYTGILYDSQISRLNLDRATGRFAWADPDKDVPAAAPTNLSDATTTIAHLSIAPSTALSIPVSTKP